MKRVALYSSSNQAAAVRQAEGVDAPVREPHQDGDRAAQSAPGRTDGFRARVRQWFRGRGGALPWIAGVALLASAFALAHEVLAPPVPRLTQRDVDAAVLHTLKTKVLPSPAARAYAAIRSSVVRVRGLGYTTSPEDLSETSVGSGVVITDKGIILTSLHVISDAERVSVEFANGFTSEASVVVTEPDQDLAVLWARTLPDDLVPATLGSTRDLAPGDRVVAVGFPFGVGPSVSAGVVSGLRREYRSPSGQGTLKNLIQFDAAVNPGSSGGPLVTTDGEVVGIVNSILNPSDEKVFVGIGFAVPIESAAAAAGTSPF